MNILLGQVSSCPLLPCDLVFCSLRLNDPVKWGLLVQDLEDETDTVIL